VSICNSVVTCSGADVDSGDAPSEGSMTWSAGAVGVSVDTGVGTVGVSVNSGMLGVLLPAIVVLI
jgi:hypothetical protein